MLPVEGARGTEAVAEGARAPMDGAYVRVRWWGGGSFSGMWRSDGLEMRVVPLRPASGLQRVGERPPAPPDPAPAAHAPGGWGSTPLPLAAGAPAAGTEAGTPRLADVSVHLPGGIHHFTAWLSPALRAGAGFQVRPTGPAAPLDRRTAMRVPVACPASIRLRSGAPAERPAALRDVGIGGCSLQVDEAVAPGTALRVTLGEAFAGLPALDGVVVHCRRGPAGFRLGLRFSGGRARDQLIRRVWVLLKGQLSGESAAGAMPGAE